MATPFLFVLMEKRMVYQPVNFAPTQSRTEQYLASQTTFAGSDIEVLFFIPAANGSFVSLEMRNIQTLTYSIFREKAPVRSLGFIGEKGRARGGRTVAGSMVFTTFDEHPLLKMMTRELGETNDVNGVDKLEYVLADQLPPFHAVIKFSNELGRDAEIILFGIEIHSEGQVHSIHDMLTENTMQYTAQHVAIMRPGGYKSAIVGGGFDNLVDAVPKKSFASIMGRTGNFSSELKQLIYKSTNPFR